MADKYDGDLSLPLCSRLESLMTDKDVGDLSPPMCSKFETLVLDDDDFSFPPSTQLDLAMNPPYVADNDDVFQEWEKISEELDWEGALHTLNESSTKPASPPPIQPPPPRQIEVYNYYYTPLLVDDDDFSTSDFEQPFVDFTKPPIELAPQRRKVPCSIDDDDDAFGDFDFSILWPNYNPAPANGQSVSRKKSRSKFLDFMDEGKFRCELLMDCERDLGILFESLNFAAGVTKSFPVDQKPHAQSAEAQKVSNLYAVLTRAGKEAEMSDAVFQALVDLCRLDNDVILYRSLRVLRRALTDVYPRVAGFYTGVRENIIIERPTSGENTAERRVWDNVDVEDTSSEKNTEKSCGLQSDEIALPKFGLDWIAVFELMSQIATRKIEECIRLEAVSIMDSLLVRSKAYSIDRERLRRVPGYQTISQFLQKDSGVDVQTAEASCETAIPAY